MSFPDFPNEIAKLCYDRFNILPKKGKPQRNKEWTSLAAVVMDVDFPKPRLKVISLSTGTKCLGFSQLSEKGDFIFDSHAEVLARRGLIRFLFHHMSLLLHNQCSDVLCFDETKQKFFLKPGTKFHFFISHIPCGDAAIFPKSLLFEENMTSNKHFDDDDRERKVKKLKLNADNIETFNNASAVPMTAMLVNDIYRTGAKCVENDLQDRKEPGDSFHVTGVLRTKPGRGDPTWSMSCSDKIALWNVCGLQGALLSIVLTHPIYISSFVFGKCPFDAKAVQRAIIDRLSAVNSLPSHFHTSCPYIYQSSLKYEYSKENMIQVNSNVIPCPAAIIWCDVPGFPEVCVNGKKQGITKKNMDKPSSRISICKSMMLENFLEIISLPTYKQTNIGFDIEDGLTYLDYKRMAKPYQDAKAAVWKVFNNWKRKPDRLQMFTLPCKSKSL